MQQPFTVRLFLDFEQDARPSMDVYGCAVLRALSAHAPAHVRVEAYRPRYPLKGKPGNPWLDRFARYCSYPLQAARVKADLNHIVDHGYAHLLGTLPPEKTIITVHDLIPLVAYRGRIPGVRRRRPVLSQFSSRFLNRSRSLIAVSQQTKADLIELCATPDDLIHVVPPGVSPEFRRLDASKAVLRERLGIDARGSFVILITGTYFYKNHETSLAVLKELRRHARRDCKIVWLGNPAASTDPRVLATGLEKAVIGARPRTAQQLVEVYNASDCLLFPSLYEGFGLPPLEAMACGIPVVCSNAASLPEVVGDAALVTTPRDVNGFAGHVEAVIDNSSQRESLIRKGLARASFFSWDRHAAALWKIYGQDRPVANSITQLSDGTTDPQPAARASARADADSATGRYD